jgi:hypothetical protein
MFYSLHNYSLYGFPTSVEVTFYLVYGIKTSLNTTSLIEDMKIWSYVDIIHDESLHLTRSSEPHNSQDFIVHML